jgi:hypothetical protein
MVVKAKSAKGHAKFVAICKLNELIEKNGLEKTESFVKYLADKFRTLGMGFLAIAQDSAQVRKLEKSIGSSFDGKIAI